VAGRTPPSSVDRGDRCLFIRSLVTLPRAPSRFVMNSSGDFLDIKTVHLHPFNAVELAVAQEISGVNLTTTWSFAALDYWWRLRWDFGSTVSTLFLPGLLRLLPFGAALTKFSNELTHSKHQASKVNCWITRQSLQRTSVCVCVMEECGRTFVFLPSTVSILCPVFVRLLKLQSCTANCVILVSPFLPSSCFLVAGDCTGIVPSCGAA